MSLPGRVITIRLSRDLSERLEALRAEFNLPLSILIRMIFSTLLVDKPLKAQVAAIERQLRKPRNVGEILR